MPATANSVDMEHSPELNWTDDDIVRTLYLYQGRHLVGTFVLLFLLRMTLNCLPDGVALSIEDGPNIFRSGLWKTEIAW